MKNTTAAAAAEMHAYARELATEVAAENAKGEFGYAYQVAFRTFFAFTDDNGIDGMALLSEILSA
jgi:hypothetical protein